jgi:hypothetical protein
MILGIEEKKDLYGHGCDMLMKIGSKGFGGIGKNEDGRWRLFLLIHILGD